MSLSYDEIEYSSFRDLTAANPTWSVFSVISGGLTYGCTGRREQRFASIATDASTFATDYPSAQSKSKFGDAWSALASAPQEDGKPQIVLAPGRPGWMFFGTSKGDDVDSSPQVRGGGQKVRMSFDGYGEQTVTLEFMEPVAIHAGKVGYTGTWTFDDEWSAYVVVGANSPSSTPGTGNCNLEDIGGYNKLVPVPNNDGSHTVTLSTAVPIWAVPAGSGEYDVDLDTGVITAATTSGKGAWNLLDIEVISYFVRGRALGFLSGEDHPETNQAEWIHQSWLFKVHVDKVSNSAGEFCGVIDFYRPNAT